jgi:two-component system OmpR family response regulator
MLVVEDDDLVRSFLCRALAGVAGEVDGCATGAEAMSAVARRRYGVILLDGLLPDIHGIDLGRQVIGHVNGASSGICLVSGSLRRPTAMHSGVSALPKPLRLRELTDAVNQLLDWQRSADGSTFDRLAMLDLLSAELLVG